MHTHRSNAHSIAIAILERHVCARRRTWPGGVGEGKRGEREIGTRTRKQQSTIDYAVVCRTPKDSCALSASTSWNRLIYMVAMLSIRVCAADSAAQTYPDLLALQDRAWHERH